MSTRAKTGVFASRAELEATIVRLRGKGLPFQKIGLNVGMSTESCWLIAIAQGAHVSNGRSMQNPPELVAQVLWLRGEGVTFSEIGRRLKMTKNKAVGIAHRAAVPQPRPAPEIEIPDGCKWIEGDVRGADTQWCAAPVSGPGSAWCPDHRRRVYQRATVPG
jgi:hypothetical protein